MAYLNAPLSTTNGSELSLPRSELRERERERERDREGLISVLVKDRERVDHTEFGIGFERIFFCLLDWGI